MQLLVHCCSSFFYKRKFSTSFTLFSMYLFFPLLKQIIKEFHEILNISWLQVVVSKPLIIMIQTLSHELLVLKQLIEFIYFLSLVDGYFSGIRRGNRKADTEDSFAPVIAVTSAPLFRVIVALFRIARQGLIHLAEPMTNRFID